MTLVVGFPPLAGSDLRIGTLQQINVSGGGVPKSPVHSTHVTSYGLLGDRQQNTRYHGGVDRAVSLWSIEIMEALRNEGHQTDPGAAGENFSIRGIDWNLVVPGVPIHVGETIELEVTGFARPCRANAQWFVDGNFRRMGEKDHPGWSRVYARVIAGGLAEQGDRIAVMTSSNRLRPSESADSTALSSITNLTAGR